MSHNKHIRQSAIIQKNYPCLVLAFIFALLLPCCLFTPPVALAWGSLQSKIMNELDKNPFLKEEKIKLRVIEEKNGYVTIEMTEGERALREGINKGFDIYSSSVFNIEELCRECSSEKIHILQKSINVIKQMDGVKEVRLKAVINTPMDQAETKFEQALKLWGSKKDDPKMVDLLRQGAELGHAPSQSLLGSAFWNGRGEVQDYGKATMWAKKAAEQGYSYAQNDLGHSYANGKGVPQDYGKAIMWYKKAAEQGNSGAQNNLGHSYANGKGVPQDYGKAAMWYEKAAEQGNFTAQKNLGALYANGKGVPQDYGKAVMWYEKAAEQGNSGAQNNLGALYAEGKGVPQDYGKAVMWYEKAAEQGNSGAQNNLAWLYATCKDSRYQNGQLAVKYAIEALKSKENGGMVDTLAAAYARNNQYDKAVRTQEKAISLLEADSDMSQEKKGEYLSECRERLSLYRNGKPFTE